MRDGGSFRDPSGFIFYEDGNVYRSIDFSYKENFNHLVNSGLYDDLVQKGLLIKHNEVDVAENNPHQYKKLLVEKIPFISYPYEWSFNQFKDALLLTLKIQKTCCLNAKIFKMLGCQLLTNEDVLFQTI